jgi:hypothetical protein
MTPGDLAKASGFASPTSLSYHTKKMVKAWLVVLSGTTKDRRISLPGKALPKEAL